MNRKTVQDVLAHHEIGEKISFTAEDLLMTDEQFDLEIKKWIRNNGGDNFEFIDATKERETEKAFYIRARIRRTR